MPIGTATKGRVMRSRFPAPRKPTTASAATSWYAVCAIVPLARVAAGPQDVPPFIVRGNVYADPA
jgi:hypothetical protein